MLVRAARRSGKLKFSNLPLRFILILLHDMVPPNHRPLTWIVGFNEDNTYQKGIKNSWFLFLITISQCKSSRLNDPTRVKHIGLRDTYVHQIKQGPELQVC